MIADTFITTKDRGDILRSSLDSLIKNTDRSQYRLTIVRDGNFEQTKFVMEEYHNLVDHVITNVQNEGLGPSINRALAHIDVGSRYYKETSAPFICYNQDDLLYTKGWLERLTRMFIMLETKHKLGFASGLECVEHTVKKDIGGGMLLKDYIRAAQMFARREYWMSMFPIDSFDPETGRKRAKPNDGIGSGVDWWFIRNHENSVCRTGRTCLVIPGLVVHAGYNRSTWLKRDLPESESDRKMIDEHR